MRVRSNDTIFQIILTDVKGDGTMYSEVNNNENDRLVHKIPSSKENFEISDGWKYALKWATVGAKVFPLKQPYEVAEPKQLKSPKHQGWQIEATTDEKTILKWASIYPDAGYGILCGDGFIALDYDDISESQFEDERERIHSYLCVNGVKPFTQLTGSERGYHEIYRVPEGHNIPTLLTLSKSCQMRGSGYFIVGTGSPIGAGYVPVYGSSIDEIGVVPQEAIDVILSLNEEKNKKAFSLEDVTDETGKIPVGSRHNTLLSFAGFLRHKGFHRQSILAQLETFNETNCVEPKPRDELIDIVEYVMQFDPTNPMIFNATTKLGQIFDGSHDHVNIQLVEWLKSSEFDPHRTESGLADVVAHIYENRIRFNWPVNRWMIYNGVFWSIDSDGYVYRLFDDALNRLIQLTGTVGDDELPKGRRKEILKWLYQMEGAYHIKASMELARPRLPITPDKFDTDPVLLNVRGGVVDLRTGKQREHRADDYHSRVCPVEYDPNFTHPEWEAFLNKVQPNKTIQQFLQRAVGYSLTGSTIEEALFFCYGPPMTGKSSFIEAILSILGSYGITSNFDTFLTHKNSNAPTESIARLNAVRFVQCNEVNKDAKFNSALIKSLTSGDTKNARFPYARDSFDFQPTFKLWLGSNFQPQIDYDDEAAFRRFYIIPFDKEIDPRERDKQLKDRLKTDPDIQKAILSWAVRGCLDWFNEMDLKAPPEIVAATREYRDKQSPLYEWLQDNCVIEPGVETPSRELYDDYIEWRRTNSQKEPTSSVRFSKQLQEFGFDKKKGRDNNYWLDIRLRTYEDEMRTLEEYEGDDDYYNVEGVEGLWDFSQPFSWEIEYIEKANENPPNPPTLHIIPDQQHLTRLLLAELKKMQPTKKVRSMCREDIIFDLAWRLHIKHYPDSNIGELKDRVVKLLDGDKELCMLFDMVVPKRT